MSLSAAASGPQRHTLRRVARMEASSSAPNELSLFLQRVAHSAPGANYPGRKVAARHARTAPPQFAGNSSAAAPWVSAVQKA